jgi:hypothetical protein
MTLILSIDCVCVFEKDLVGERGFEPPTPWSRTRCSTRLSHSPTNVQACAEEKRERRNDSSLEGRNTFKV